MIREIPQSDFKCILEIGCGTGIYTQLLRERFKHSSIKSIDIAEKMVGIAREKLKDSKVKISVEDAEDMKIGNRYGLITSNAALQWVKSMEGMIKIYHGKLTGNGALTFSVFGPLTFKELGNALKEACTNKGLSIASRGFLSKEELERMLGKYFREFSVRELVIKEEYPSLAKLLEKIKNTGVRGSGYNLPLNRGFTWSRRLLKIVEDVYEREYGSIIATYQVFLCKALK